MTSIGVIGCGKLGICYAILFAKANYKVICYEINKEIIDDIINDKYNYLEPNLNNLIKNYKNNLIFVNEIKEVINNCDNIFTFIQTPSLPEGNYDHSYIDNFIKECIKLEKQEITKNIIISSTVMPNYCNSLLNKLKDYNYDIIYNPSFIAQGSIINNIIKPDFILIGNNSNNYDKIIKIHEQIIDDKEIIFKTMNLLEAELTKISINCFITTKISYANLVGDFAKSLNCNPSVILDAIGTDTRIGKKYLNYGYGFGGPCLPRDNKALYYYFNNINNNSNINFDICKITDRNNYNHLLFQFDELKSSKEPIEFRYITYKDTSDIIEESQKLKLALMLADNGNEIIIYERKEIIEKIKDKYKKLNFININPSV